MNQDFTLEPGSKTSVSAVAIRYALIVGIINIIYSIILYITDLHITSKFLSYVSFLIIIVGIYLAHKHFKNENGGYMSYGQGLGIGTLLSGIVGLLSGIFTFIYMQFIDTGLMERAQEMQIVELEKRGMSEEQIEQALKMAQSFTSPGMMIVWSIVAFLFVGFLFSLIISAITKHTRPEFE